jgi:Ca2+/Na+ antiporter
MDPFLVIMIYVFTLMTSVYFWLAVILVTVLIVYYCVVVKRNRQRK